jgi:hypothetical protein
VTFDFRTDTPPEGIRTLLVPHCGGITKPSPLGDTLDRYVDFFELFGDFSGYVEFFHLQD